jgi:hypothetical protein
VEGSALLEELVHQGSFTVVNVGDNGDVSDFRLIHKGLFWFLFILGPNLEKRAANCNTLKYA